MPDDFNQKKECGMSISDILDHMQSIMGDYRYAEDLFNNAETDHQLMERSNQTREQQQRDTQITRLLEAYVNTYITRTQRNLNYKEILFYVSIMLFVALVVACLLAILATMTKKTLQMVDGIALISVCITAIGSIAFLLEIIAKHIFPEGEDKNITDIVQAIQKNDLDDKQVNIKALEWWKAAERAMKQTQTNESEKEA